MNGEAPVGARFAARLHAAGAELRAGRPTTLQVNVGRKCNQACRHCHVDASPQRTEVMPDDVFEACLSALERWPELATVDITGGAPEIHPRFREMVARARALGRHVMVRHNLTVQHEPGQFDLPEFFAAHRCEVVCSLPHYTAEATDRQRGRGEDRAGEKACGHGESYRATRTLYASLHTSSRAPSPLILVSENRNW